MPFPLRGSLTRGPAHCSAEHVSPSPPLPRASTLRTLAPGRGRTCATPDSAPGPGRWCLSRAMKDPAGSARCRARAAAAPLLEILPGDSSRAYCGRAARTALVNLSSYSSRTRCRAASEAKWHVNQRARSLARAHAMTTQCHAHRSRRTQRMHRAWLTRGPVHRLQRGGSIFTCSRCDVHVATRGGTTVKPLCVAASATGSAPI